MQNKNNINLSTLKEANFSLVIRAIRANYPCSRISLCKKTDLQQATMTKIVGQLISWGLVTETEAIESNLGRKPIGLMINSDKYPVCVVRLQRSLVEVALGYMDGRLSDFSGYKINMSSNAHLVIDQIKKMISNLIASASIKPIAISVALPGPFDIHKERITLMSGFPGWHEINIRAELEKDFSIPIFLEHDANCGVLAEQWFGNHEDDNNMLYIAAAEGVGAGILLDGGISRGMQGFAGELGHMSINMYGSRCECGNRGCLELYTTTRALEEEYKRKQFEINDGENIQSDELFLPAEEILNRVRNGSDRAADEAYKHIVSILGFGIVSAINCLNPKVVIFADTLTDGGEIFLKHIDNVLKKHLIDDVYTTINVSVSSLQKQAILLGAGAIAFDQLLEKPSEFFL